MFRSVVATLALTLAVLNTTPADSQEHQHGHHTMPQEVGQATFAAIQEVVEMLRNDPQTDWSRVDIPALRRHLLDMHEVTVNAIVEVEITGLEVAFTATGEGRTIHSIRRMLSAHARSDDLPEGWRLSAATIADGAVMLVQVLDPEDISMIKALGLIGLMTMGMHHQSHHLVMALGHHSH